MNQALTQVRAWTGVDFLLMFLMWVVMMTAMMVPTTAPMILTFATINRKRLEQQQPYVPTGSFPIGLPGGLERLRRGGHRRSVGSQYGGPAVPDDGQLQPIFRGWTLTGGRVFSSGVPSSTPALATAAPPWASS